MLNKIYTASKVKHAVLWKALRSAGFNINSTWIDLEGEIKDKPSHWITCIAEARDADIVLLYVEHGEEHKGAMVEAGAALGAGKHVVYVGPDDFSSSTHHPNVIMFRSLSDALRYIDVVVPVRGAVG